MADDIPHIDLATATRHVYQTIAGAEYTMHWFTCHERRRTPAVIFFHGGGWASGSPQQFAWLASECARRGIAAAGIVHYRLLGKDAASVWDCIADGKAAVRWVRKNADQLDIDQHRLCISGGSAGGHLALATTFLDDEADGADTSISSIANLLIVFNPVVNTDAGTRWESNFAGRGRKGSPMHNVRPGLPELLLMNGSQDEVTPLSEAKEFIRAMNDAGNHATLAPYADCGHGFFNKPPHLWATSNLFFDTLARRGWAPRVLPKNSDS